MNVILVVKKKSYLKVYTKLNFILIDDKRYL